MTMIYVITELTPPGRVLAETDADDGLGALSAYGEREGYARLDELTDDEREELGFRTMHGGRFAAVSFGNHEILASPAGEELN